MCALRHPSFKGKVGGSLQTGCCNFGGKLPGKAEGVTWRVTCIGGLQGLGEGQGVGVGRRLKVYIFGVWWLGGKSS